MQEELDIVIARQHYVKKELKVLNDRCIFLQNQHDALKTRIFHFNHNQIFLAVQNAVLLQDVAEIVYNYLTNDICWKCKHMFIRSFGCRNCKLQCEKYGCISYVSNTEVLFYQLSSLFFDNSYLAYFLQSENDKEVLNYILEQHVPERFYVRRTRKVSQGFKLNFSYGKDGMGWLVYTLELMLPLLPRSICFE